MALADDFDGLLIDLDGVVWIGREPVPGSPETLAALLAAGKEIVFVTNNPARRPAAYAERLRGLGVEVGGGADRHRRHGRRAAGRRGGRAGRRRLRDRRRSR